MPERRLFGPHLWHAHLLLDAAKNGQGITLANDLIAKSALQSGQLVAIRPHGEPFAPVEIGSYFFTARADRWTNRAVARLRLWLVAEIANTAHG